MDVIRTKGLCKSYGAKYAVEQLEMVVPKGAVYGFIGQNGAGKSTTQKMICGLAYPTSGEIKLFGKDVDDPDVRKKTGALIESAGLYPGLSARENMMLHGLSLGIKDLEKKVAEKLEIVRMSETGKKKVKHFSTGMKQRTGIAMALLGEPELLVLDEPINGLDPEGIREFRQIMTQLNSQGMTILISSHILGELSKIATHYGIIKKGRLMQQISAKELQENCEEYLCVKMPDAGKAVELLKRSMSIEKCEIVGSDELHLHGLKESRGVMQLLATNGFSVQEIFQHKQDLEEYFLDYMGWSDVARPASPGAKGGEDNA